ncbi:RlmE family RNA methyltransferase [Halorarum halobium]|uniref:RlmE family RNA methyltransferase n=1 Tax=Halorarum halobium TaxID=3075121 RepID=UPI0028AF9EE0|nr:23S rRNA (uridine(2552)-2'-O)-methyltransferase [Halobaculum sp. XH14]
MGRKDEYYNKAKQQGYRARSAYKLQQLDEESDLFSGGETVVDLGAAPGGWLQVAAERVGDHGRVVGVDFQSIDGLEHDHVKTVRGDMTEDRTRYYLRKALGAEEGEQVVDVVVSDMAPNMSGEYSLDHARSIHLARQAFEVALELLKPGGDFVVKVFDGQDLADFRADVEPEFQYVRAYTPEASRKQSSERYLIGKGRTDAPVAEDDEVELKIVDVGDEGDGIARIEGFTVFVSGAEEGETVRARVGDVKPRFAFAERLD